jgi:hypothetical protein
MQAHKIVISANTVGDMDLEKLTAYTEERRAANCSGDYGVSRDVYEDYLKDVEFILSQRDKFEPFQLFEAIVDQNTAILSQRITWKHEKTNAAIQSKSEERRIKLMKGEPID